MKKIIIVILTIIIVFSNAVQASPVVYSCEMHVKTNAGLSEDTLTFTAIFDPEKLDGTLVGPSKSRSMRTIIDQFGKVVFFSNDMTANVIFTLIRTENGTSAHTTYHEINPFKGTKVVNLIGKCTK